MLLHIRVGAPVCLQHIADIVFLEGFQRVVQQLLGHFLILQHLSVGDDVASGAGNDTVKADAQHKGLDAGHVASGRNKNFMSVFLCAVQRINGDI